LPSVLIAFLAYAAAGQTGPKDTKAVLQASGTTGVIHVTLSEDDTPESLPDVTVVAIDKKLTKVITVTPRNLTAPYRDFYIDFPGYDASKALNYETVLTFDTTDSGTRYKRRLVLNVEPTLNLKLERGAVGCVGDNRMKLFISAPNVDPINNPYDWTTVLDWLNDVKNNRKNFAGLVVKQTGEADRNYKVSIHPSMVLGATGNIVPVCLALDDDLPIGAFDAELQINPLTKPPPDINTTVTAKKLAGTVATPFPEDKEADAPEKKELEHTLDIGVAFTSSVETEDVEVKEGTPAATIRKRHNRGVLDIGFEYPQVLNTVYRANDWMWFLTPFFLKATVSTGKIDKDTLSQNRVLFGFEGETRYRKRVKKADGTTPFTAIHRIEWGGTHASDRDFKQKEIYASISYKPVWDSLYKPYRLNYTAAGGPKGWGFTFEPSAGFDFGKTYSRRNPVAAIEESDIIRRLNFGVKLGLDITSRISLTAEDTYYIRWESSDDRSKNLFKAQGDFKLFRSSRNRLSHGLFVVYEKGQGPPFATPDVNSVRVGYRMIGDFCRIACR